MPNRLASSSSPYLRQHAENPIDWFPWGPEAFDKARSEQKPVLLSVGYSSCHWCHVMAHESFEDAEAAALLNEHFVCIKVDREERPDVDDTYMTAVQLSSGRGGWPMTLFLTPEKKPFFAGTYLPRDDRQGHPGFLSVIRGIASGWRTSRKEFEEAAEEFARAIGETLARRLPPASDLPGLEQVRSCLHALAHDFDSHFGGFGPAPKFPPHTALELLIELGRSHQVSGEERALALEMADRTLYSMALGGIRDHVGGGFHRYSTNAHWLLPHFEKMLVDNALMLANYALAFRVLGRDLYKEVSDEIVEWLEREMLGPDGLYCSALDADSEGEEGVYYVWTWDEVRALLGERSVVFLETYGFAPNGNFADEATGKRTGANIPHLAEISSANDFRQDLSMLASARDRRPRPGRDDKALVGQNGLLIAGFVASDRLDRARQLAARLWELWRDGELPRQVVDGKLEGMGFLEDYAGLGFGLSQLAAADPQGPWGGFADQVAEEIARRFLDEDGTELRSSGRGHEVLFGSSRPMFDQPAPSAAALACRLFLATGRRNLAERVLESAAGWLQRAPTATEAFHVALLTALSAEGPVRVWVGYLDRAAGTAEVRLDIEDGWHVAGPEGDSIGASTLVYTSLPSRVDYPKGPYTGSIRIPFTVDSVSGGPCEVSVSWQPCTDRECSLPGSATFTMLFG